jgi:hypothetical protein
MKGSNLLITLTDMVSYSRTKKIKKGHIMAQKRKNRAQKALYRLVTIKKYSGWGDYCAFDCSKKHILLFPHPPSSPPPARKESLH